MPEYKLTVLKRQYATAIVTVRAPDYEAALDELEDQIATGYLTRDQIKWLVPQDEDAELEIIA